MIPFLMFFFVGVAHAKPNFVYILMDDTDLLLGSADAMLHRTKALIADEGATFTQFTTLSPKCTPSRTGQLVGRHYHNVRPSPTTERWKPPPGGGLNETTMFEPTALFPMLHSHGYWTSIVGKVHNNQKGWLCSKHNITFPFTHISTQCQPCGGYWHTKYTVKDIGQATTHLETIDPTDWSSYSHAQYGNRSAEFIPQRRQGGQAVLCVRRHHGPAPSLAARAVAFALREQVEARSPAQSKL